MRLVLPFALVLAACTPDPPKQVATVLLPPAAPSGAPAKSAAPMTSSSSTGAPALPFGITICELAKAHHGAWIPTVDEVVAAAVVLPSQCLGPKDRAPAIRACAARHGAATVKVGVGTLDEGATCEESFLPATWNGRRWIVLDVSSFADARATGSAFAAELRGATATRYVDNEGFGSCGSTGRVPEKAPADWAELPVDLARFLCGFHR